MYPFHCNNKSASSFSMIVFEWMLQHYTVFCAVQYFNKISFIEDSFLISILKMWLINNRDIII